MNVLGWFLGIVALVLTGFMLVTSGWDRPPITDEQSGYRGTGMVHVANPRDEAALAGAALHQAPAASPQASDSGPRAGEVYQNVQVLGDLSVAQFTRLMQAMTEWVSPEQGCNYCHVQGNFASEDVYTKHVSRRMIQMTQHINGEWQQHVARTGVTCHTCHRGENLPAGSWLPHRESDSFTGMAGNRAGQNAPAETVGLASLPADPFTPFLDGDHDIRVAGGTALPTGNRKSIKQTEWTYSLMMHMSQSLGVNCTYCHNSRAFRNWDQGNPARVTAWHGIRLARAVNNDYIDPLASVLPASRKDAEGNPLRVNCNTCHLGINKPLYGAQMAADYPSLAADGGATTRAPAGEDPEVDQDEDESEVALAGE